MRYVSLSAFLAATIMLEDSDVPFGGIAAALGYSAASAFTHAFRRWAGQTPTAWRDQGRPGMTGQLV